MQFRSFDKEKPSHRSLTPLSNCSSNFDTIIEGSQYNPASLQRTIVDEDYTKQVPLRFKFGLPTYRLLESLELELKKLDYRFEFIKLDDSPSTVFNCFQEAASFLISKANQSASRYPERKVASNDLCGSCIKMKNLMDEAKFSIEREKESLENTEKHLKHYDSLLAIKENRLKEQELAFDNERNLIEIQKSEISREKLLNEKEKDRIAEGLKSLEYEKENVEKQMITLEKKYQNVKKILGEYEKQKLDNETLAKSEALRELEQKEVYLRQKEVEVNKKSEELKAKARQLERSFKEKTGLFEKLKQEVINKQKVIIRKKEKIAEMKKRIELGTANTTPNLENVESRMKEMDLREMTLKQKADELMNLQQRLNDEKNRVEVMMRSVSEEKMDLDMEIQNSRRSFQDKIRQAQVTEERFRERMAAMDSKEQKLEQMIQAFQEEELKLEERWKNLENIHAITSELSQTKEKLQSLQKAYAVQQQELSEYKVKSIESPLQFTPDWKDRLESLAKKEEDLQELEDQLNKEREEIEISAALIRQLNEDLERQKISQKKEEIRLKDLEKQLKQKENEVKVEISQLDIDKSFKNSSQGSFHRILVSDMSPFDDKDIFHIEGNYS